MDIYTFVIQMVIAAPPLIIALITLYKVLRVKDDVREVHLAINSRLDELIAATTTASIAIGRRQIETEQAEAAKMPN